MSLFQAIILGLVQGLTEFFPVSSSAHLKLMKWLLGMQTGAEFVYFDLMCHAGTLVALLVFLRKEIWEVIKTPRKMALYLLALGPLVPAYFLLKPVRVMLSEPGYLGYALMATGLLLWAASRKKEIGESKKWGHVLCIGVMQTMALIPGISRSGSTIAMGRFCGWKWKEAAQFSFLLAVPTILGGELLETLRGHASEDVSVGCYATGFLVSLLVGLGSVRFVFWIYEREKVRPLAAYCLGLGLVTWALFHG